MLVTDKINIINPFKNKKTTSYQDWEVLKDLKWHCARCELKSAQAKTWQVWKQNGIQMAQDKNDNFYLRQNCPTCLGTTIHRKLKSLTILKETKIRFGVSAKLVQKIKAFYDNQEAVFLRQMPPKELEIDHKFPQVRWNKNEEKFSNQMSDDEIKTKFMLLTRSNNLLKSRFCEKCVKTGKRGSFPGIYFWGEGDENWNGQTNSDENGCKGCFWYDPYQWRKDLNEKLNLKNNKIIVKS